MPKPLSLAEIRLNAHRFAADWQGVDSERAESQSFWNELLEVFGVSRRRRGVMFEYRARRADTGNYGFIDVFWPKVFLAEQKSGGKITQTADTEESNAEAQARAYLLGGDITEQNAPRYVITSDFRSIQLTDLDLDKSDSNRTLTFETKDLADHVEDLAFIAGYQPRSFYSRDQEMASIEAARLMADIFVAAAGDITQNDTRSPEDETAKSLEASLLLTRLLFLLFGDDAGLWERGSFTRFIHERTAEDGSDLGSQLQALFDVLNTPEDSRSKRIDELLRAFPYVNGGLYSERRAIQYFDRSMRDALIRACEFDWTSISPAVFGSLFQSIKSREARRGDGEHYTSEENILKTLHPLFLDEIEQEIRNARGKSKERERLRSLWRSFSEQRYLDPACGCGNFLLIAYREMRKLELDIILRLRELDSKSGGENQLALDELADKGLLVRLDQFHGIEINWWPAKIAEVAMYLVDHQCDRRMAEALGESPSRLPIKISAKIHHANALSDNWSALTGLDENTPVWVFGNPPYAGHETRTAEQTAELKRAWRTDQIGRLDYVTAWHQQAVTFLKPRKGDFAFVTTNSISQGDQAPRLMKALLAEGWRIKFAHRTFRWSAEVSARDTAAVYVVIVGYSRAPGKALLFDYASPDAKAANAVPVDNINEYLVEGDHLLIEPRNTPLSPSLPVAAYGNMPRDGGNLIVSGDEFDSLDTDPIAKRYLYPFIGADELLYNKSRWCIWMNEPHPEDERRSPFLKSRFRQVAQFRLSDPSKPGKRRADSTRKMASTPYLFGQRPQAKKPLTAVTVIPRHVSEDRPYFTVRKYPVGTIVADSAFFANDPDGLLFALMSSSMFLTWQRTVGGALEGRLRFSNTLTWNNFPMPDIPTDLRAKIIEAGIGIDSIRALHPDRHLADHYNPRAMDLKLIKAHTALDRLVDRAFGATRICQSERERQVLLFLRYKELTATTLEPPSDMRSSARRKKATKDRTEI